MNSTRTTSASVWSPRIRPNSSASDDITVPMPCAKRFGGPGTWTFSPSRGAITFIAVQASGLSFGPASTRAQKP